MNAPLPPCRPLFNDRPLVTAALGFAAGVAVCFLLPAGSVWIAAPLLAACGIPLHVWGFRRSALLLFCFALGLLRAALPDLALPGRAAALLLPVRDALATRIDALFPSPAGVAAGMLLGGGAADIDAVLRDRLMAIGIGHLLAVSGLHVSVLAGSLLLFWRDRALRLRNAVIVLFLLFYCAVTAFTPSVVRASVMFLCVLPAPHLLRRKDPLSALSLAALLILLVVPGALQTTGFQLSFCCVLGLVLLSPLLSRRLSVLPRPVAQAVSASLAVTLATVPLCCRFFRRIGVFSLCANLLIVPLAPFFLVPALLSTAVSFFSFPVGDWIAGLPRFVLSVMMRLADAGSAAVLSVPAPGVLSALLWLAAAVLLSRCCLRSPRRRALYAALALLLSLLCWPVSLIM